MPSRHKHHLSRFYFVIPNHPHQMPLAAPPSLQTQPQGPWQRQRQEAVVTLSTHAHAYTRAHTHTHTRQGASPDSAPGKQNYPDQDLSWGHFCSKRAPHRRDHPPSTPCSLDSAPSPAQTETWDTGLRTELQEREGRRRATPPEATPPRGQAPGRSEAVTTSSAKPRPWKSPPRHAPLCDHALRPRLLG